MERAIAIKDNMAAAQKRNITQVINDYSRRLLGFIRKRVTNEADAEDILQDVFYQLMGNKEPIDHVASWLFTVARNKITDSKRKKQPLATDFLFSGPEDEMVEWMEILMDDSSNPETVYLRNLFQETLKEALNELPEEQKQAFVLNELDGIPFKQLSDE